MTGQRLSTGELESEVPWRGGGARFLARPSSNLSIERERDKGEPPAETIRANHAQCA